MRIIQAENYQKMSRQAANILSAQIILKPDSVLGLATGSSPIGLYRKLVEWYEKGDLDFSQVRTVNLDEYKGLGPDHTQSYRYFMNENLFHHVNIDRKNTFVPNGLAEDAEAECARYDQVIGQMGGIDLQLLGIGHNGHIGFNEPGEVYTKGTHCVALTESTLQANARLFDRPEDVPRYAYTMGIASIMQAKKILLIASGEEKAEILQRAFYGPITPKVPASILQLHPDVTLIGDKAALSCIR